MRNHEEIDPLGLHSHDLYHIDPNHPIPKEFLPSSWGGGLPQIGEFRYAVWSYEIALKCQTAKPKLTPAIWCTPNFPDPEAPPITLLPPKEAAEECSSDDMYVFYPSVVKALGDRGLTIPQCTISHAGDGVLCIEIEENEGPPVYMTHEEPPINLIRWVPSKITMPPNSLTTIGTIHRGNPMPIFTLYSGDRPQGDYLSEARLPFRIFAMRIEEPLLNLLARPVGSNSDYV